ncbi:MAG: DUF4202 family protein [Cystobacter sp.]
MLQQLLLSETESGAEAARYSSPGAFALLRTEFPTLAVGLRAPGEGGAQVRLEAPEWRAPLFDPSLWDERVFGAATARPDECLRLHLTGAPRPALETTALEVLTRYQGLIGRRNAASEGALFDALLTRHRALYELSRPHALSNYRHALDTWQWVLRLEPQADLALQAAALFHDVEQPGSEPPARLQPLGRDDQDAHAGRSAALTHEVLRELGLEPGLGERVRRLILHHERSATAPGLALLNDADALSFFSLQASGFARAFPRSQTRRTVARTLGRLRPQQRWRLARIRLAPQVRRLLEEALGASPLPVMRQESA